MASADTTKNGMACGMVAGYVCNNGSCVSGSATCGNGMREAGEQCDDGNTTNLDGCDSNCKFEQSQRINNLAIAFAHDTYCTKDALGEAIVGTTARGQISTAINNGINDGSITIIFDDLALDDLTGQTDPTAFVGVLGGSPKAGSTTYSGGTNTTCSGPLMGKNTMNQNVYACDLDWWYTTDPTTIDNTRTATTQMPASFAGGVLNAGPKEVSITVSFVGVAVTMDMFNTKIKMTVGASSAPTASSGMSPGHLASEHLDPALTSYASATAGELCGNTTAQSLANVQVPSVLVGSVCNQNYSTTNTLLDVYISGCTALFIPEVRVTQPDVSRDGATYIFTANNQHFVTSCTRNGAAATLATCLANAGYTSLFPYTTDRVIPK
jgi:cysteine-rich repeat protein